MSNIFIICDQQWRYHAVQGSQVNRNDTTCYKTGIRIMDSITGWRIHHMNLGRIAFVPDLLALVFKAFKMETVKIPEIWAI